MTGGIYKTGPVCSKSSDKHVVQDAIDSAEKSALSADDKPLIFRNSKNSKADYLTISLYTVV
ncbi:MAG: hypothetical protein H0A75_04675 [Candidatus Methanofishera endochildressiae]|uniref:Uncharacterized protein n=1 Tax=Candidatus Methanofishera endochildressiae TaxID=2738884 RepID=A0A7Z0MP67_9GAMM|nr:hypothetical protein [Candidatus Methanofishera endochildressiae]